ncbi:NnrU family protein [Vannielia sp.]|uniref:NnrU family protein n=1 Tax=Vannielia sp. TaxID=2813045 RepID=UPI002612BC19|nr:NnrU family protein [Vannielia sp.]MDF1871807.1 NnrU family protein [Vannielia sp.]
MALPLLILGIALWWLGHLFKRLAPARRAAMGDKGRGPVALVLVASIVLMVIGFRMADDVPELWNPPYFLRHINNLLVLIAIYFMSPGPKKGAIFYRMRHPMLAGFALWAFAHLLVNGDLASVILFGALLVWSLAEMVVINRAEPGWTPPAKGSIAKDAMFLVASVILLGIIGYIHGLLGYPVFG